MYEVQLLPHELNFFPVKMEIHMSIFDSVADYMQNE